MFPRKVALGAKMYATCSPRLPGDLKAEALCLQVKNHRGELKMHSASAHLRDPSYAPVISFAK